MECDICLIEWDSKNNIPKILPCGHTICFTCLKGMLDISIRKEASYLCPNCKYDLGKTIKNDKDIENLLSNITLLDIVKKLENRKELLTTSKFIILFLISSPYMQILRLICFLILGIIFSRLILLF